MKFISNAYNLHKQWNSSDGLLREFYPAFFKKDHKTRIIWVQPRIDRYELYTLIGPAFYLPVGPNPTNPNVIPNISSLVTGFEADTREFEDNLSVLEFMQREEFFTEYVPLADIVVFPFTYQKLGSQPSVDKISIYEQIRRANPNVRILYTVDFDYYDVPKDHFNYKLIQSHIPNIEDNIRNADGIICGNDDLPELIVKKSKLKGIRAILIPALFDQFHFADIDWAKPPENQRTGKVRIGIPSDFYRRPDIEKWKSLYLWLHNNYQDKVELVFYGYHPDKEIDLRDARQGLINNEQIFPKPRGKAKYKNFVSYYRQRRNDYIYNFKNFYNLNCHAWLFFYDQDHNFNKYGPKDVDMLYAVYAEIPIFTNQDTLSNQKAYHTIEEAKEALTEFIEYNIKYPRLKTTPYTQAAINFGHQAVHEITWKSDVLTQIEEQFISFAKNR